MSSRKLSYHEDNLRTVPLLNDIDIADYEAHASFYRKMVPKKKP